MPRSGWMKPMRINGSVEDEDRSLAVFSSTEVILEVWQERVAAFEMGGQGQGAQAEADPFWRSDS